MRNQGAGGRLARLREVERGVGRGLILLAVIAALAGVMLFEPVKDWVRETYFDPAAREEKAYFGSLAGDNLRVKGVQAMLKELKVYDGPVDGHMDAGTRSAMRMFQEKNGLETSGRADAQTRREMGKQTLAQSRNTMAMRNKPDEVKVSYNSRQMQMLLRDAGFYKGKIDGIMGAQTVRALKQFQKSKSLPETGIVSEKTWKELQVFEKR